MGVVHLAVGPDGGLVAVKVLRPWVVGGDDGRDRFAREAAALQRVRGARIAEVLDADVSGDPPYVVTRYVRGSPLSKVVADHGPLRGEALNRLASGLAEALASVHAAGVIHRDIKPGNVLLTDDGPVLIDFGLARALDETRLTMTGMVVGTPGYLAPEVVSGGAPSPATDVHGWAATVVFAATGRPPYGTGPDAVVLDRIRRGEHDLTGVDPNLAPVLSRALAFEPEHRPSITEIHSGNGLAVSDATVALARDATAGDTPTTTDPATAAVPPAPPTKIDTAPPAPPRPPAPPAGTPGQRQPRDELSRERQPAAPPWTGPPSMAPPLRTWPARIAVGLGWLALLILLATVPRVGLPVVFVVMVATRTAWRVRQSLYERRVARGYQPSDRWVMAAGTPWHVVVTSLQSVFHLAWIAVAGFVAGAAVALWQPTEVGLPYLAGASVALLLTWFGPGTRRIRHGVRILTAPLDRDARAGWIVAGVMAAITWVLLLVWESAGTGWPYFDQVDDWIETIRATLPL